MIFVFPGVRQRFSPARGRPALAALNAAFPTAPVAATIPPVMAMKLLLTGISHCGRKELQEEFAAYCRERGKTVLIENIGDLIKRRAREVGLHLTDEKILDTDEAVLSLARMAAFSEMMQRAGDHDLTILSVHTIFRWRGVMLQGVSLREMVENPMDLYINIVDDVSAIQQRMAANAQWRGMLTVQMISDWLDQEEYNTRQYARFHQKPYYLIARSHPIPNLYELVFSARKRVYLSYPITHVRHNAALLAQIRAFGQMLAEHMVVFDPLYIKDLELAGLGEEREVFAGNVADITDQAINSIKTRTITRDYQFVAQSDFVVVVYPVQTISPGVLSEMNYAHRHGKPVYAVFPFERSPFFETMCTRIFDTTDELTDWFRQQGWMAQT